MKQEVKTRKAKRKKTSPIFTQLVDDEESSWWRYFFEQLGNGIFPHRLSYINGSLSYLKNGKFIQLLIENKDLEDVREEVKNYIRTVVGIIPDDDIEEFSTVSSYNEITWKIITKDSTLRDILISKYIASLKLSRAEQNIIRSEIWWGFLKDEFTSANFTIEKRRIVNYYPNSNKKEMKNKKETFHIIDKITPPKMKGADPRAPTKWQILHQLNKVGNKEYMVTNH